MFASLHCHDEFSLLDGAGTARQHAEAARDAGYVALASTNHETLAGSLHHMTACREAGIIPISGVECYYRPNRKVQGQKEWRYHYYHLTLLAKDLRGWHSLMRINSAAHQSGFYEKACVDDELLEKHHEGLICLTGCIGGKLIQSILKEDHRGCDAWVKQLKRIFRDDLFMEIMPHDYAKMKIANVEVARLADHHGLGVVTTIDAHYPTAEWAPTQDVLLMISTNSSLRKREKRREGGKDVFEFDVPTYYHLTRDQIGGMYRDFHPDLSAALVERSMDDTLAVAALTTPFLVDRSEKMPVVSFPGHDDNAVYLRELSMAGLERRGYAGDQRYVDQVEFELATFVRLKSVEQMLMAWDVIDWAKSDRPIPKRAKNGELVYEGSKKPIMVGAGRGSVSGSCVAWAIGIANVNPIKHRLLFERFLNPERVGKPDIDIDFSPDRVDEVEDYVKVIHGPKNVVDIIAHSTFGPRAALTDVGRVLCVPYDHVKSATKTIDDKNAGKLDQIRALNPAVDRYATDYPEAYEHSRRIQGMVARKSEHAGGILVLPGPVEEYIPVERTGGMKGKMLSAFGERANTSEAKHNTLISDYGYYKLDVLRVAELRKQQLAVDLYEERTGDRIVLDDLPVHDDPYACEPEVMQVFKDGLLVGVFQFSAVAAKLTRRVQPENIFDLASINALIRPGPRGAGMDDDFVERKAGRRERSIWHESLTPHLDYTQNLMIFQEQLVQVVHVLGGLSLAQADIFRKITSKLYRDPEFARATMSKWYEPIRDGFMSAGVSSEIFGSPGVDGGEPTGIWKQFLSFSDYAFNACLSGDTLVEKGGRGKYQDSATVSLADLYKQQQSKTALGSKIRDPKRGVKLLQMSDDGRIRPLRLKRVTYNGKKPVLKIILDNGRQIKATQNHRLLSPGGYVLVEDLHVGDDLIVEMPREAYANKRNTGRGRNHVAGSTGSNTGSGFGTGDTNPAWLDGRRAVLEASQVIVRDRALGVCECCSIAAGNGTHDIECAHILTLEQCGGDYLVFHAVENLSALCNSCHKKLDYRKGERVARWTRGRPTGTSRVVAIEPCGTEDVYDVEMDSEEHNFVANGIISHNSHAIGYSLLAYRDAWLKVHMPREFYSALLSVGLSQVIKKRIVQKAEAVREARHLGLKIMPPDINVSGRSYTVVDGGIRLGLEAIKNIGPAAALAIETHRPFESMSDVERRVPAQALNVTSRASLVMSGACDRWGARDGFTEEHIDACERDLLGMSLTSVHSIAAYADAIDGRFWTEVEFDAEEDGARVVVVGEVSAVKEYVDKKGGVMCFVDLVYGPNHWSCTMFSSLYETYKDLVHSRRPLMIMGSKSTYNGRSSVRVEGLPVDDDSDWVAPVIDLADFVEMRGNESEQLAADSVFPEDLPEQMQS